MSLSIDPSSRRLHSGRYLLILIVTLVVIVAPARLRAGDILGSETYRPEVQGRTAIVAAGHHFSAVAGMRLVGLGGNAIDAGVAATFAAAVTEISHFGMGGEVPILLYLAERDEVLVINGQGTAPAAATAEHFRAAGGIPANGPAAGAVPAVVDSLLITLAEYGTRSLAEVLGPAIEFADGFPWYAFLDEVMERELDDVRKHPSGAQAYLQGPDQSIPEIGSVFRQPDLARTLRQLVEAEQSYQGDDRKAAIYAARDRFYRGDIATRIAAAVDAAGGLLTAADLAGYRGRIEAPARLKFRTAGAEFEVFKTGFWGQGPVLLQTLAILQGYDLAAMGHNSTEYIHTVTEALKLALADRDAHYGDPDFAEVPAVGLLSADYANARRALIEPERAHNLQRPGDPWVFEPKAGPVPARTYPQPAAGIYAAATFASPDTTSINAVDAAGNLFSASPSSAWFFGGVFIAGDTGVPLGNRLQAFALAGDDHPNQVRPHKRPRTTLTPTLVSRDGKPFLALSTPGGDAQDQQNLQVFLNIAVFGMRPQQAIEAPRFNTMQYQKSFGDHEILPGVLVLENRIPRSVSRALGKLGHKVKRVGPFMMLTATTLVGIDQRNGTLTGAADVRGQRFVTGW